MTSTGELFDEAPLGRGGGRELRRHPGSAAAADVLGHPAGVRVAVRRARRVDAGGNLVAASPYIHDDTVFAVVLAPDES
jgi:hypothetical protein